MKTGLVSISFRQKSINELIKASKESGLEYIEWGGDVHIPMGNIKLARKVRRQMHGAGLKVASYGSYFGIIYHCDEKFPLPFKKVLKTAKSPCWIISSYRCGRQVSDYSTFIIALAGYKTICF